MEFAITRHNSMDEKASAKMAPLNELLQPVGLQATGFGHKVTITKFANNNRNMGRTVASLLCGMMKDK